MVGRTGPGRPGLRTPRYLARAALPSGPSWRKFGVLRCPGLCAPGEGRGGKAHRRRIPPTRTRDLSVALEAGRPLRLRSDAWAFHRVPRDIVHRTRAPRAGRPRPALATRSSKRPFASGRRLAQRRRGLRTMRLPSGESPPAAAATVCFFPGRHTRRVDSALSGRRVGVFRLRCSGRSTPAKALAANRTWIQWGVATKKLRGCSPRDALRLGPGSTAFRWDLARQTTSASPRPPVVASRCEP